MNTWRIGSKWGKKDLINVFKKEKILFAGLEIQDKINTVKRGDIIAITNAKEIVGLAKAYRISELSQINSTYVEEYADVTAIIITDCFWKEDHKSFDFGIYGGQGKQFHQARKEYHDLILDKYKELESMNKKKHLKKLFRSTKNLVLTGAPGTGKTFLAMELAADLIGCKRKDLIGDGTKRNQFAFVQFHPAYAYEDFVEGLKPKLDDETNGSISFELRKGIFSKFCELAKTDSENDYVFVIDEINRADLSRVFGELFFSLEPGYRGESGCVVTQYSSMYKKTECKHFFVPTNVFLIATMNDIDRSVESIDFALRRRFAWYEVKADEILFRHVMSDLLIENQQMKHDAERRYSALNNLIKTDPGLGESYCVGPAYFRKLVDYINDEQNVWDSFWSYNLEPLLKEYLRGSVAAETRLSAFKNAFSLVEIDE